MTAVLLNATTKARRNSHAFHSRRNPRPPHCILRRPAPGPTCWPSHSPFAPRVRRPLTRPTCQSPVPASLAAGATVAPTMGGDHRYGKRYVTRSRPP